MTALGAPALNTVSDYVSYARILLQDQVDSPYRYPDSDLVTGLNLAFPEAKLLRPDLFLTTQLQAFSGVDGTVVTFEPMYAIALVYYMCGQAQLRDDEEVQDQRAAAFLSLFAQKLRTGT
jgi:hypothetical protein